MAGKFEIKKSSDGQFMFTLKAGNGEIIFTSQRYPSKASALRGITSVQTNALLDDRFEWRTSTSHQPYFVLKATNHEIIGSSEMYSSKAAMEKGIRSVQENALTAEITDLT